MSYLQIKRNKVTTSKPLVLVLNKGYMPIDVRPWGVAIGDIFTGRADIVHNYEDVTLHAGFDAITNSQFTMPCPAVVRMVHSDVGVYAMSTTLPLTRKNILDRDKGKCAYCGTYLNMSSMSIDHVYPESKGGLTDWMNLRACCTKCNSTKGSKTLSELGWTLRSRVGIPTLSKDAPKNIINKIGGRIEHESWRKYIYWSVETKEKIRDV